MRNRAAQKYESEFVAERDVGAATQLFKVSASTSDEEEEVGEEVFLLLLLLLLPFFSSPLFFSSWLWRGGFYMEVEKTSFGGVLLELRKMK